MTWSLPIKLIVKVTVHARHTCTVYWTVVTLNTETALIKRPPKQRTSPPFFFPLLVSLSFFAWSYLPSPPLFSSPYLPSPFLFLLPLCCLFPLVFFPSPRALPSLFILPPFSSYPPLSFLLFLLPLGVLFPLPLSPLLVSVLSSRHSFPFFLFPPTFSRPLPLFSFMPLSILFLFSLPIICSLFSLSFVWSYLCITFGLFSLFRWPFRQLAGGSQIGVQCIKRSCHTQWLYMELKEILKNIVLNTTNAF